MGMGFCIVCAPEAANELMSKLKTKSKIVGKIVKGDDVLLV